MLALTEKDKIAINSSYQDFLNKLKKVLIENRFSNPLECYKVIYYLIYNGNFSQNNEIIFDTTYNYLSLSNLDNESIYVMHGICCCRHINSLVHDILKIMDFDSSLLYIKILENGTWQKTNNAIGANHLVVSLKTLEKEYLIDAMNNLLLHVNNSDLENIENFIDDFQEKIFSNYKDSNVNDIGRILKKYYSIRDSGINHVYEY